jgi:hypothetical protein
VIPSPFTHWHEKTRAEKLATIRLIVLAVFALGIASCFFAVANSPPPPPDPVIDAKVAAKIWLKNNLRDPDSLEIIKMEPMGGDAKSLVLAVEYRAKNGLGGYNVETKLFLVKNGEIAEVNDFNPAVGLPAPAR